MAVLETSDIKRIFCFKLIRKIQLKQHITSNKLKFLHRSPTSSGVVTLKTGRREVPGSSPSSCRPRRSEFSVVFSETRVNTG